MIVLLLFEIAHTDSRVCTTAKDNLHAWDLEDSRRLEARTSWMAITHVLWVRWRHAFGITMRHLKRITIFFPRHDIMMVLGGVSGEGASPQAMQES